MKLDPRDVELCVSVEPDAAGAVIEPLVPSALFAFSSFAALADGLAAEHRHRVYSRGQNPTVEALESKLAALERGQACKAFASGMAAVAATCVGLLEAGDHVLFVNRIYGPTLELAEQLERFGVTHTVARDTSPEAVEANLNPSTRLVWVESPATMTFETLDLAAVAEIAHSHGAWVAVDNSWATPLLQKPLAQGADLVIHACSKYLGGHSDVIAGAVVTSEELLERIFYRSYLLLGGALSPFDAWLVLRGLRTLPTRLGQHEMGGLAVAHYLAKHRAVCQVYHPGLVQGEEIDPTTRGLRGYSGLFSFELAVDHTGAYASVARVLDALRIFRLGVSWGGPESLAISPVRADNAEALRVQGLAPGLVRLSIGLEPVESLVDDLEQALAQL